ncbi:MAG TPA: sulfoxide reductase heme-binding subunit YedZ [Gemmatimonadetes bacterium]|uniref:Ferric oxidoreductase domain-containing protein n=1 Tax=marine metagenome TaxID=408172 RepID=A0A381NXS9_9ZZZZ|nr:sulfoxide reductase heme-binding subunit YedZ [Gemmatimonadota bacterium]MCH2463467.1 sulfoxide reductase heme-binding subunit YedZ [Gemmatimonadota bacterium]MEC7847675.1 protein-methionine-sulfoxide reductase heme-binding subunit MsrQ [Gemmatimonadota bacterium]HAT17769.1 sulfoxide reductase heme-binding subunit YedZ [Gemmatimonadota bacterium]HAW90468.1 sulfoxide reductase heme-binding subunit YedZ [Gemmatimonadota bacterium]
MNKKRRVLLLKGLVWLLCLAPGVWLVWRGFTDRLGANAIEEVLHRLGDTSLVILLVTLSITPIRRLTGWNDLAPLRRPLGLFAFFYLTTHFLWYAVVDEGLAFEFIVEDVIERPYILAGFTAWLMLIPLAITSTKGWIRRLKKNWQKLHRLVYVATGLGVLHFYWQVKADTYWPLVATTVLVALMLLRIRQARRPSQRSLAD